MGSHRGIKEFVIGTNFWPFSFLYAFLYKLGIIYLSWRLRKIKSVRALYLTGSAALHDQCFGISDVDFYVVIGSEHKQDTVQLSAIELAISDAISLFPFLGPYDERTSAIVTVDQNGQCDDLNFLYRSQTCAFVEIFKRGNWSLKQTSTNDVLPLLSELTLIIRGLIDGIRRGNDNLYFWKSKFRALLLALANRPDPKLIDQHLDLTEGERDLLTALWNTPNRKLAISHDAATAALAYCLFWQVLETVFKLNRLDELAETTVALEQIAYQTISATVISAKEGTISCSQAQPFEEMGAFLLDDLPPHVHLADLRKLPYAEASTILTEVHKRGLDCIYYLDRFVIRIAAGDIGVGDNILSPFAFLKSGSATLTAKEFVLERCIEQQRQASANIKERFSRPAGDEGGANRSLPAASPYLLFVEDDLKIVRSLLEYYRLSKISAKRFIVYRTTEDVFIDLLKEFPHHEEFLTSLRSYHRRLKSRQPQLEIGLPPNFFGYLNQFFLSLSSEGEMPAPSWLHSKLTLSLCVCTKDRPALLEALLRSISAQSRLPDELVIVDNSANGQTEDLVQLFSKQLPIKYCRDSSGSIAVLRNRALTESTKQIVAFTDDDCILDEDWLANVERTFLRSDRIGAIGGVVQHLHAGIESTIDEFYGRYLGSAPRC